MKNVNRISEHLFAPSPAEIEAECQMIRSHWSPELKEKRSCSFRLDQADKMAQANLRFLRFLAECATSES